MTPELRVLHVVAASVQDPSQRDLGSTKDVRGRTQYFSTRGIPVDEVAHGRSRAAFGDALRHVDPSQYSDIFVEFPLSWRALKALRKTAPDVRIHSRSENAELLHRLDWARASYGTPRQAARLVVRAANNTLNEVRVGQHSDVVLPISEWEARHYWPKLVKREKIRFLPYYLPDAYQLLPIDPSVRGQENLCICLTSTRSNPLILDALRNFDLAVRGLSASVARGWTFAATGAVEDFPLDGRVIRLGLMPTLDDVLRRTRLVALLSDFGYGFKTKLLDAIAAGSRVAVTPKLWSRMPRSLDPWVLRVDLDEPGSFAAALEAATAHPPVGDPNRELREQHDATLDALFSR